VQEGGNSLDVQIESKKKFRKNLSGIFSLKKSCWGMETFKKKIKKQQG